MSTQGNEVQQTTDDKQAISQQADAGWIGKIREKYYKVKGDAEAYPYVWGSYIVVYGGFGLWFAYRWRKLRRTEDRVCVLQDRLRKMVETKESGAASSSGTKKDQ